MRSIGSHGTCMKSQHWGILGRGLQVQGQPELHRGSVKRERKKCNTKKKQRTQYHLWHSTKSIGYKLEFLRGTHTVPEEGWSLSSLL